MPEKALRRTDRVVVWGNPVASSSPRSNFGPIKIKDLTANTTSTAILDLAYRVERLVPHPRRPERFHEDKSEIVATLYRLAHEVRRG